MATEVMLAIDADGRPSGATAADAEALAGLAGATYRAVLTSPKGRSLSQTALYFVMCDLIADNYDAHDADLTKEAVDHILRIECGHYTVHRLCDDTYVRTAKSIAFNKMTPDAFARFLDLALAKAAEKFGDGLAAAAAEELARLVSPDLNRVAADTRKAA